MLSKSKVHALSKLSLKKFREIENKFIVEGKRLISEGLNSDFKCLEILATQKFMDHDFEYANFLKSKKNNIVIITESEITKISSTKNPQGIAAVFEKPKPAKINFKDELIVCLENISDPGNIGTILRSCDWFGVKTVLLSNTCAELYNPKVLRASMGAIFNLDVFENINLIEKLEDLKKQNYKIYFADMNGLDYRELNNSEKLNIIFCNEAFGPSNELRKVCNSSITIPRKGKIESLNVSAAAAVILSHLTN